LRQHLVGEKRKTQERMFGWTNINSISISVMARGNKSLTWNPSVVISLSTPLAFEGVLPEEQLWLSNRELSRICF